MTKIMNLAGLLMLVILPLIGIAVTDHDLSEYMQFPPLTHYVEHAPFSQAVAVGLAIFLVAVVLPFIVRVGLANFTKHGDYAVAGNVNGSNKRGATLLFWGLATVAVFWYLSWTRLAWFANFQIYTFTPIWLGYILVVNGITQLRSGHCMLLDKTKLFIRLFIVSAAFWWFFEYLNRFVQNWYYIGIGELTPFEYFIYATLPFSTVLPAVLGTADMLKTFPQLYAGLDNFSPWFTKPLRVLNSHPVQWGVLAFFAIGLTLIGVWPNYLFPLLWVSPLVIFSAISAIRGKKTIWAKLAENDWREIVLLALASLICGFFWEMWNLHSVAKWIYEVPFVTKFKVFEMPLLGYSGYLPFGLECAVVARLFVGNVSCVTLRAKSETDGHKIATTETNIIAVKLSSVMLYTNGLIIIALATYFFLIPGFIVISNVTDPALKEGRIPAAAWRLHKYLTPRYANYARERIKSKIAGKINKYDVPATEWPLFGSVFYLWATANLQEAWEEGEHQYSLDPPVEYAKETIEACKDLLLDPVHHTWVREHWGKNYLHKKNLFFRSLLIAGLTSYEKLTKSGKYIHLLKDQCDTLAAELDASQYGVIYDYPSECYPIDVFAAVAWIKRADAVTGADHSAFFARELRAFQGDRLDRHGLIPWMVNPRTGEKIKPDSRGIINSHILTFCPDIYPELAEKWYSTFTKYFWQKKWYGEGWREFYKNDEQSRLHRNVEQRMEKEKGNVEHRTLNVEHRMEKEKLNVEHRTSNVEHRMEKEKLNVEHRTLNVEHRMKKGEGNIEWKRNVEHSTLNVEHRMKKEKLNVEQRIKGKDKFLLASNSEWTFDVDSGPIIGGFSPAANAFGFAAAERNGRLDHAYILASQVLTAVWPLPDGSLLGCKALSNSHAPYLGECGILWQLTVTPKKGIKLVKGGHLGGGFYIGMVIAFGTFLLVLMAVMLKIRAFRKITQQGKLVPLFNIKLQFICWLSFIAGAFVMLFFNPIIALLLLLVLNIFPKHSSVDKTKKESNER